MGKVLISMPDQMLKALDNLVKEGVYASRSEAIRDGLRLLFQSHEGEKGEGESEFSDFMSAMGEPRDFSYS
jgi:Arc/MetJ-type ribon-helix-helix transcriptional regulator